MSHVRPAASEPLDENIYVTPYDRHMLQTTGPSVPTGFASLHDAKEAFGTPRVTTLQYLVYRDVVVSRFVWSYTCSE
jgi:hypothetical protein